jgi:hypothetical protein
VVLAEASQVAIQKITEAVQNQELRHVPVGRKYIEAVKSLSGSSNAKMICFRPTCRPPCAGSSALWVNENASFGRKRPDRNLGGDGLLRLR